MAQKDIGKIPLRLSVFARNIINSPLSQHQKMKLI